MIRCGISLGENIQQSKGGKKMKNTVRNLIFGAFVVMPLFTVPMPASAASPNLKNIKVRYAGTQGNGDVIVSLDTSVVDSAGCTSNVVRVPNNSPAKDSVLSIAMAAYLSGTTVTVQTNGCDGPVPTLDNSENSWFNFNELPSSQ